MLNSPTEHKTTCYKPTPQKAKQVSIQLIYSECVSSFWKKDITPTVIKVVACDQWKLCENTGSKIFITILVVFFLYMIGLAGI